MIDAMPVPDERIRSALDPATTEWRSRTGLRDAAVLAPWFSRGGEDFLLYTKRQDDLPTHGGEISFPGGAREGAENALECALRESCEEVGIDPATVDVLGRLPERVSIASYVVQIFVGRIPSPDGLSLDRSEVDEILEIPVVQLADESRWELRTLEPPPHRRRIPFFEFQGRVLWGLTGIFTIDLLKRLEVYG